jgi:probable poly-beta-1,6-N-acetyl-D-glucosamine export protein
MVRRMLYLNGFAIFCVVIFHSVGLGFVAMFDWAPRLLPEAAASSPVGSPGYWVYRLVEQLVVFCIPAFLFVSGYFVAAATGKSRDTIGWDIVFARIKKLLIPYLIWSAVAMGLLLVLDGRRFSPQAILVNLLTGRSNDILYFVPLLVQYYLLSPFLVRFARRNWKLLLIVTGLVQLVVQGIQLAILVGGSAPWVGTLQDITPKWLFTGRIFWFACGIVIGFYPEKFKEALYRMRWVLLSVSAVAIPLAMWEWEFYFRRADVWLGQRETLLDIFCTVTVIGCFFAFAAVRLPLTRFFENLGKDTYGVYLVHLFFITYTAKLIYRLLPPLLNDPILLLVILSAAGLVGSLALMRLVQRSPARKFYSYLFG